MDNEARKIAQEFDGLIDQAFRELRNPWALDPHRRGSVIALVDAYEDGGIYPVDRLLGTVERAVDLQLQFHYIQYVLGQINHQYYARGGGIEEPAPLVLVRLVREALDQDLIVKSRILWERAMNLVYYIETGRTIEARSKKTKFWKFCEEERPQWWWLLAYKPRVDKYDDALRTPEVHKLSTLRRRFLGDGSHIDANFLLDPVNDVGLVWRNVVSIIGGGGVALNLAHDLDRDGNRLPLDTEFDYWGWNPGS